MKKYINCLCIISLILVLCSCNNANEDKYPMVKINAATEESNLMPEKDTTVEMGINDATVVSTEVNESTETPRLVSPPPTDVDEKFPDGGCLSVEEYEDMQNHTIADGKQNIEPVWKYEILNIRFVLNKDKYDLDNYECRYNGEGKYNYNGFYVNTEKFEAYYELNQDWGNISTTYIHDLYNQVTSSDVELITADDNMEYLIEKDTDKYFLMTSIYKYIDLNITITPKEGYTIDDITKDEINALLLDKSDYNIEIISNEDPSLIAAEEVDEKPVIYLYGYDNVDVKVSLDLDGKLDTVYPAPNSSTSSHVDWSVKGLSDGRIKVGKNIYRYLFWEGKQYNTDWAFEKGFCVTGNETQKFLENELYSFGLTSEEIADFITYWVPRMKNNPYNVISFQTKTYSNKAVLNVEPAPDTQVRVFMAWYPSAKKVDIPAQKFSAPKREGKVVIEWGGVEVNKETKDEKEEVKEEDKKETKQEDTKKEETKQEESKQIEPVIAPTPVVQDPYAQYGSQAQCAKDWDNTAAGKAGKKWAQLDSGTRQAAYNHWVGHGTSGW